MRKFKILYPDGGGRIATKMVEADEFYIEGGVVIFAIKNKNGHNGNIIAFKDFHSVEEQ